MIKLDSDISYSDTDTDIDNNIAKKDNNNWTEAKIRKLLDWQQQSRIHSVGHARAEEIYTRKNNMILIPSMAIGAIATLFEGITLVWSEYHKPFLVVALLLTATITILNSVLQITKPEALASDHANMSKGYNRVIIDIDTTLAKEPCERMNGTSFLNKIMVELIALKTGSVKIPTEVWKDIKAGFLKGELEFQKITEDPTAPFLTKATLRRSIACGVPPLVLDNEPIHKDAIHEDEAPDHIEVDIPDTCTAGLPRFELIMDNDPVSRKIQDRLFDFQMSRFG